MKCLCNFASGKNRSLGHVHMMKLSGKPGEEVSVCQICEGFAGELPSKYGPGMLVMRSTPLRTLL